MRRLAPLLAILVALAPALALAAPREMTVAALRKAGAPLEGQTVRIRGVLDECTDARCNVCDSSVAKPDTCIVVQTWSGATKRDDDDRAFTREQRATDQHYRFAEVILTARISFYGDDDKAAADAADAETDWSLVDPVPCVSSRWCQEPGDLWLEEASVERVLVRHAAVDGLVTLPQPLKPASKQDAEAVRIAFAGLNASEVPASDAHVYVQGRDRPFFAWLCLNEDGRGTDRWPTLAAHLLPAPANSYRCFIAERDGETWRFAWYNSL